VAVEVTGVSIGVDAAIPGTVDESTVFVDDAGGEGGMGIFVGGVVGAGVSVGGVGVAPVSRCSVTRVIVRINATISNTPMLRFTHKVTYVKIANKVPAMYTFSRALRRANGGECEKNTMYKRITAPDTKSVCDTFI
jgi:hypothetical protein